MQQAEIDNINNSLLRIQDMARMAIAMGQAGDVVFIEHKDASALITLAEAIERYSEEGQNALAKIGSFSV